MTHKGKKLELCNYCGEYFSCQQPCDAAIKFDSDDNSANYQEKCSYVAKNSIKSTWMPPRMNGGKNRFK